MGDYPELKKVGYALLGFAILFVAGWLRWQSVKDADAPPPAVVEQALPDMTVPALTPEEFDRAMEHMKSVVEKAAAEERRRERKKKRTTIRHGVQWEGEAPP
jgi:hypothetical protein